MKPITRETAIAEGWYAPNERDGYCYCGCGEKTPIAPQGSRRYEMVAGEHRRYIRGHVIRTAGQAARMRDVMAKPPRDLAGQVFGSWTTVRHIVDGGRGYWECVCECSPGVVRRVEGHALTSGQTRSCGCRRAELMVAAVTKHGRAGAGDSLYTRWSSMIQRCTNQNCSSYHNYGGRGIAVCERWRNSFAAFLEDMGDPPPGLTLDRIDNDGDYEPGNVRYATVSEQNANRRSWSEIQAANGPLR